MDQPLISAIICCYNEENNIAKCIQSILNQEYTKIEIVIVNDASEDGTETEILKIADKRIKYFKNDINKGRGYSRNRAVSVAKGEFLAICDADDISLPNRFSDSIKLMYESNSDIVGGQNLYIYNGKYYDFGNYPTDAISINLKFKRFSMGISHPTSLVRKSLFEKLGGYDIYCKRAQDLEFMLRCYNANAKFIASPNYFIIYTRYPLSDTFKWAVKMEEYKNYAVNRYIEKTNPALSYRKNSLIKLLIIFILMKVRGYIKRKRIQNAF